MSEIEIPMEVGLTRIFPAPGNTPPAYPVPVFRTTGARFHVTDVWATIDGHTMRLATESFTPSGQLMITVYDCEPK